MKNNLIRDKSFDFALKTIELSKLLLKHQELIISNQFGKSGTSIGANVNLNNLNNMPISQCANNNLNFNGYSLISSRCDNPSNSWKANTC